MAATLMTHCGAQRVDYVTLARMPTPPATDTWKPIQHSHLVDALLAGLAQRQLRVTGAQYAVSHQGMRLFGTLTFGEGEDYERCLGFRASNDKRLPLEIVAGANTVVCDHLLLSGDVVALKRKHTARLDLKREVEAGLDSYLQHQERTEQRIAHIKAVCLNDQTAKAAIYDLLQQRILPSRLLHPIHAAYFHPADHWTDCQPRTVWGLHNACTRVLESLDLRQRFAGTLALGRYVQL